MGRYARPEDVIAEYPDDLLERLSDDARTGVIDTQQIENAIAWAEAYVDASISTRYRVPLRTSPETVKRWVVDLAVWRLFQRWVDDERVQRKRELVERQLDSVRRGEMSIPGAEADEKELIAVYVAESINWPEPGGRL